jgi:hypothetical protein
VWVEPADDASAQTIPATVDPLLGPSGVRRRVARSWALARAVFSARSRAGAAYDR